MFKALRVRVLIIRIRFGGILYYKYKDPPPTKKPILITKAPTLGFGCLVPA